MPNVAQITDAYAAVTDYRETIKKVDAGADDVIARNLISVSRFVDRCTGRFFTRDAAPVQRVYAASSSLRLLGQLPIGWAESENPYRWGPWARHLVVDDMCVAPTSVVIDWNQDGVFNTPGDITLNVTNLGHPSMFQDFELWDLDAPFGPEPKPWTTIVLPIRSQLIGFLAGTRIAVTATWGWPAIPPAIVDATIQLTAILRLETPRATSSMTDVGVVVGTSPQARSIIHDLKANYTKHESVV